jgi:hypothetical protein
MQAGYSLPTCAEQMSQKRRVFILTFFNITPRFIETGD